MWYRIAQENLAEETFKRSNQKFENRKALRSEIRKDPNGISITFYSPIINYKNLNEFYQEYPNVRIYFKKPTDFKNTRLGEGTDLGFNISPDQVNEILKRILNIFTKYTLYYIFTYIFN